MLLVPVLLGTMGFEAAKELHQYIQTSGAGGGYGLFVFLTLFGGIGAVSSFGEVTPPTGEAWSTVARVVRQFRERRWKATSPSVALTQFQF